MLSNYDERMGRSMNAQIALMRSESAIALQGEPYPAVKQASQGYPCSRYSSPLLPLGEALRQGRRISRHGAGDYFLASALAKIRLLVCVTLRQGSGLIEPPH